MTRRRSVVAEVVTIYWRDIPVQVNGQSGRERHQILLSGKFMQAVERAKRRARITTAAQDVAQWRRTSEACDNHVAVAEQTAQELEQRYSRSALDRLAKSAGRNTLTKNALPHQFWPRSPGEAEDHG